MYNVHSYFSISLSSSISVSQSLHLPRHLHLTHHLYLPPIAVNEKKSLRGNASKNLGRVPYC